MSSSNISFVLVGIFACLIQNTISQAIGIGNGIGCGNNLIGNPAMNAIGSNALSLNGIGNGLGINGLGLGNIGFSGVPNGLTSLPNGGSSSIGYGDVAVAGELPVGGATAVTGNVPVIGYVTFEGTVPAGGIVSVASNCGCNSY